MPLGVVTVGETPAGDVPATLVAVTLNVYAVVLASPVIAADRAVAATTTVLPPGLGTTVNFVHGAPPSDSGAAQVTLAVPMPTVAATERGAVGATGATALATLQPSDTSAPPPTFCAVRQTVCSPSSAVTTVDRPWLLP